MPSDLPLRAPGAWSREWAWHAPTMTHAWQEAAPCTSSDGICRVSVSPSIKWALLEAAGPSLWAGAPAVGCQMSQARTLGRDEGAKLSAVVSCTGDDPKTSMNE